MHLQVQAGSESILSEGNNAGMVGAVIGKPIFKIVFEDFQIYFLTIQMKFLEHLTTCNSIQVYFS